MDEQLLRDLVKQLQDLVPTLRALGPSATGKGDPVEKASVAFDRSSSRIVAAIGKLAAQLDKNTRSKNAEERSLAQFVKEVERATDAQEKAAKEVADFASEIDAAGDVARRAAEDAAKISSKTAKDIAQGRYNEYQKEQALLTNYAAMQARDMLSVSQSQASLSSILEQLGGDTAESQLRMLHLGQALEGLGNISKSVTRTLADLGQNGATSFTQLNGVVDAVTGAITKMAASLPFFGAAMTALAEGAKFALASMQQVSDNFREAAKVGALTADGMTGLANASIESGISQRALIATIRENSTAFSQLGGTVGDGTKQFTKFVGGITKTPLGMQLRNLGLGADEIAESAAAFVALQGRLGATQRMTQAQLTEGTIRYTRELDAISKITGMERKELQGKMNAALSEQRFRAKMQELERTGQGKVAEQLNQFQAAVSKSAPGLAQGLRDIIAAGGAVTTDAAREAMQATGGQISTIAREALSGKDIGQSLSALQGAVKQGTQQFEKTAQFADLSGVLGNYAELVDFTTVAAGDLGKAMTAARETVTKQAEGQDQLTNKVVFAQQQLELAAKEAEKFALSMVNVAAPAVAAFTDVLAKSTIKLNEVLGVGGPPATVDQANRTYAKTNDFAGMGESSGAAPAPAARTPVPAAPATAPGAAPAAATRTAPAAAPAARPTGPSGAENLTGAATIRPDNVLQFTGRSGSAGAFAGLDSRLQQAVLAAASEYNATTGKKLQINSAKRDPADQRRLYAEYLARGRTGMPVAPPGKSKHEQGLAVDIQNYNDPVAVAAMNRQGLKQTVMPNDPVHFSFAKGGIASGPKSGYKAMLHGTEAVVPLPDGKKIPVNMQDATGGNLTKQMDMMSAQLMRLDEMVSLMRRQVGVSDKMLRVSQS